VSIRPFLSGEGHDCLVPRVGGPITPGRARVPRWARRGRWRHGRQQRRDCGPGTLSRWRRRSCWPIANSGDDDAQRAHRLLRPALRLAEAGLV